MSGRIVSAEFAGTFILVFAGCGAAAVGSIYGTPGNMGISLVFGLAVLAVIYSVGNISGAHINPAVTLGFAMAGRLPWKTVPQYAFSQTAGAIAAGFAVATLFPEAMTIGEVSPSASAAQAFAMEAILTSILMFVILNVSTGHMEKGIMAGVAVGGTVAMAALFGGPISGASLNPARYSGPAIASGSLRHYLLYLTAPLAGAIIASPTCRLIQNRECCVSGRSGTDE